MVTKETQSNKPTLGEGKGTPVDISKFFESRKKVEARLSDWQAKIDSAIPYDESITRVSFMVDNVFGQTTNHTQNNGICGPGYHEHVSGQSYTLTMRVTPEDKKIQTRELSFEGYSSVVAGDRIVAYIAKCDREVGPNSAILNGNSEIFIPREFKESELATKIEIYRAGRLVKTDLPAID